MMSSLTLGIRAPAAIPRASNITAKMDKEATQGYNTNLQERDHFVTITIDTLRLNLDPIMT